eukprot:9436291-Alexandrium_andersonii.AAC.1
MQRAVNLEQPAGVRVLNYARALACRHSELGPRVGAPGARTATGTGGQQALGIRTAGPSAQRARAATARWCCARRGQKQPSSSKREA